jgi:hypothetical protein
MSDIDKVSRDMKINGYVHPVENIPKKPNNSNNPYKTFNTEKKDTDYVSSNNKSVYATFSDKKDTPKKDTPKECPDCGGEAYYCCDCDLNDQQCANGHIWYTDRSGKIKRGDPHENE